MAANTNTSNAAASPAVVANTPEMAKIVLKEIGAKWDKLSAADLGEIKGKDDLVTKLVAHYSLDKGQAYRDVEALLNGRQI